MNALRKILLTGGPDARDLCVVDADTGELLAGVVKIELLCTPHGGALVNVTQACQLEQIGMVARDAGEPLIDLPDDHPEVKAAEALDAMCQRVLAADLPAGAWLDRVTPEPGSARLQALEAAGVRSRVDVPVQVVPPKQKRYRRTKAEMLTARAPAAAPIAEPPPLPEAPSENARRAPPPPPEPDLSEPEKGELARLLAKAVAEAAADEPLRVIKTDAMSEGDKQFVRESIFNTEPRATLPPGAPWPFTGSRWNHSKEKK